MPYFTPPVVLRNPETTSRLYGRLQIPTGVTVIKSASGGYSTVECPAPELIDAAAAVYLGGRTYEVSAEEAASLTAAGYEVT